jgi:cytochrome c-type biogenesis protein CcmF
MFLGKLCIALGAVLSLWVTYAYFRVGRGDAEAARWGRRAYYGFTACISAATLYLLYLFVAHDFRVEYVYSYSSRSDSLIYNVAGLWGGQQGTFLLWLFMGSLVGLWLVRRAQDEHAGFSVFYYMGVQIFLLAVLLAKSPFALLPGLQAGLPPADGRGLNPLLQDPWMAIHPPVVFAGFASAAVPFALALAALTLNRYKGWAERAQPWVTFSVITLGTGLVMGGYWAYKVLGWGGYWAWDPVENSIIIPWFVSLALMHGLIMERKDGSLRKTNLFLAMLGFVLVMYGTFLTRSGVLADFSVHSFVDLGLNAYLVAFMLGFLALGLGWLGFRYQSIKAPDTHRKLASREFIVFLSALLLAVTAALVLAGTSSPLFTRLWGDPAAVSIDYYNRITFPIAILLALVMGCAPYLRWRGEGVKVGQKLATIALVALAATGVAWLAGVRTPGYLAFCFATLFAAAGNLLYMVMYYRQTWYLAGSYVSHLGFGIMLLGVLASSAFSTSEKIELQQGDVKPALGYDFKYVGRTEQSGEEGRLDVAVRREGEFFMAHPRYYWSEFNQGYMRKPHIHKTALYDIYVAPEEHFAPGERPEDKFANSLELVRGQSATYGDVEYTFDEFEIGSHGDSTGSMRVVAHVRAKAYDGKVTPLQPYMELTADGGRVVGPATLDDGTRVVLDGIQADAGAILLKFEKPGVQTAQASLLVLQVSRKPLVGLVWIGSVLAIVGALMALYFRGSTALALEGLQGDEGWTGDVQGAPERKSEPVA